MSYKVSQKSVQLSSSNSESDNLLYLSSKPIQIDISNSYIYARNTVNKAQVSFLENISGKTASDVMRGGSYV
ncbi:hypothetical protein C9J27_06940 [Photobacterium kishitanii]|uniref:Uncharacterized protein n=1 Tax=Photobacterium kishitanii TaxID=318456 RepID=A0A2T3KK61_9GAMM|nr:hypothetical protein C9J27_06940 [Photobacterium kishitanii]PSV09326.1 hypothetical protein C0W28_20415 [Photobacterium kishitanii]